MAKARNKAPRRKPKKVPGQAAPVKVTVLSARLSASVKTNRGKLKAFSSLNDHVLSLKRSMSTYIQTQRQRLLCDRSALTAEYKLFESASLNAWERQALFQDVLGTYLRRISELLGNHRFFLQSGWTYQPYQKDVTRRGQVIAHKGDVRPHSFELGRRGTPLTQAVNYLLQCDLVHFDTAKLSDVGKEVLGPYLDTPKWPRLLALVAARQARLLQRIGVHQFTTGTHRRSATESRSGVEVDLSNKKFRYWYCLRIGVGKGSRLIRVPLVRGKNYLDPATFRLTSDHYVSFKRGKAHIVLTREAPAPTFGPKGKTVGLDANTKHNLLASSEHVAYDYNRIWLDTMLAVLLDLDAKKGNRPLTYKERGRLAKLMRANEAAIKLRIHEVLAELQAAGVTDIVLEDLGQFKGTMASRHPLIEQKYTRLLRLLRLSSLKDWIASQAEKRHIRVHLTHAAYTSQQCPNPLCGHIAKGNRDTQEVFCCEKCGHTAPADFVAGENLAHRLGSDVLRPLLHTFDKFGRARPRPMPRAELKRLLLGTGEGGGGALDLLTPSSTNNGPGALGTHGETPPIPGNGLGGE